MFNINLWKKIGWFGKRGNKKNKEEHLFSCCLLYISFPPPPLANTGKDSTFHTEIQFKQVYKLKTSKLEKR